jgi:hypothetical protein
MVAISGMPRDKCVYRILIGKPEENTWIKKAYMEGQY